MQWGEKYTRMRSYTARKFIARKFFYEIAKILLQIEGGISNIKINIEYSHMYDVLNGVRLSITRNINMELLYLHKRIYYNIAIVILIKEYYHSLTSHTVVNETSMHLHSDCSGGSVCHCK